MAKGEWNKEWFVKELESHPMIMSFVGNANKLLDTVSEQHECDTNYRCHMQGNFFINFGYSRYTGAPGATHGWVMFGQGCTSAEQKVLEYLKGAITQWGRRTW